MNRLLLALALCAGTASAATTPQMMDFQGKLLDASHNPRRGSVDITFSLFAAASGGTALWSETQLGVPVENGVFDVKLGTVSALTTGLFNRGALYLEIQVSPEGVMTPRQPVLMAPYAFRALLADDLAPGNTNYIQVTSGLQSGGVFHVSSGTVEGSFLAADASSFTAAGGATYSVAASSGLRLLNGTMSVEGSGGLKADGVVSAATVTASTGLFLPQGPASTAEGSARWDPAQNLLFIGTATANKTLLDTDSVQTSTNKTLNSTGGNLVDANYFQTRALSAVAPSNGMTLKWDAASSKWLPTFMSTVTVVTHNFTPTGSIALTANVIYVVPMTIPGVLQLNQIRYRIGSRRTGCSGDVGLYDSSGNLVASGGTSSADCSTTGAKTVAVAGAPVTVYGGQYYAAITVNNSPSPIGINLFAGSIGVIKGLGTAAETGGTTLPASINLGAVTDGSIAIFMGFNN